MASGLKVIAALGAIAAGAAAIFAFKKHKDTLGYFNKNYVNKEIFPREIGRKISRLEVIRHKSDYDTFYIASREDALEQIDVAKEVVELVKDYLVQKGLF